MVCLLRQIHVNNIHLIRDLNRNSSVPCTYEYEYVSYVTFMYFRHTNSTCSAIYSHVLVYLLQVSVVVVVVQ